MDDICTIAKRIDSAEKLAEIYLAHYFKDRPTVYPINPFQMLVDEGVLFALRDFGKLEGVFVPARDAEDEPFVGISLNRPITRMRFTAAHELCHYLRDTEMQVCELGAPSKSERFADSFASAILMPADVMQKLIDERLQSGFITFDDVLEIAELFGASFESCLFRCAYHFRVIEGDTKAKTLRKLVSKYKPDKQRKARGYSNVLLYESLVNTYEFALRFEPNEFVKNVFLNNYIYNDSRLEKVEVNREEAAEIVTDVRLNKQNSRYCTDTNEAYLSVAGHAVMYLSLLDPRGKSNLSVSIYDLFLLHGKLFSCFPYPEFGGKLRTINVLVTGAKFETLDHDKIPYALQELDLELKMLLDIRHEISVSEYIEKIVDLHHKLTVVHPFPDGNGRTLRVFLNKLLISNHLSPVYIKYENKTEYVAALSAADRSDNKPLYEFFFRMILRTSSELTR